MAIFAVSMPLLGELLQYDAHFRETTMMKAEAVERLCDSWALAFPSRLVAAEMADAGKALRYLAEDIDTTVLSPDRYWFPNIADSFGDLRKQFREEAERRVVELPLQTRVMRRKAKKLLGKLDPVKAASAAAPEMAATFGLPVEAITGSVVALLRGKITPEEASFRLFGAIAQPARFVEAYFEKLDGDSSTIPEWMGKFGREFEALFSRLRDQASTLLVSETDRANFDTLLSDWPEELGKAALGLAGDDVAEFGIDQEALRVLKADPNFAAMVPVCEIVGNVTTAYVRQILGLTGNAARIERSFGGDMVHALYLPHVDLWRGDRRFSALVRNAVPRYSGRVVPTLKELPALIDAWQRH